MDYKETIERQKKLCAEYEPGDLVVYGNNGVCRIDEITRMSMPGNKKKYYYFRLVPVDNENSCIYVLVGQEKVVMRKIITENEALDLISDVPNLTEIWIENDKMREDTYKAAIRSCECREWFRIIKTLYKRNKERVEQGKKITSTDERYLKEAKNYLYAELALVLKKKREDMEDFITNTINAELVES